MNPIELILMLVILVVVVVGLVLYYLQHRRNKNEEAAAARTPVEGEGDALREKGATAAFVRKLKVAAWKRGLLFLEPDADKSGFCALLIGPSGVTAVYADDHRGTVYGGDDKEWAQIVTGVRRTFESPLITAETARKELRDLVNAGKFRPFAVNAKTVLVSDKAEYVIPRSTPTQTAKDFLRYVQVSPELMTDRKVDEKAIEAYLAGRLTGAQPQSGN